MSIESQSNSKRLAKNTLLLYARMILLLLVNLYTSRVILNGLGVDDYGIYNVVGGIVTMFTMLSGSLTAAITRFITFELGTGNKEKLKRIFSASVTIQIAISLIVFILAETVGLWLMNEKLVIPENRMVAANWCYQFSIVTFVINLISIPYNSAIIAHEKMSAFAYISIFEAIGKLLIAFCIVVSPIDNLIFYGLMVAVLAIVIRIIYGWYCKKKFEECEYHFIWDKALLSQMFAFAGWNFIGSSATILRDQGGNIILNMFFGPAVNAARAIAVKVNSVLTGFVTNFMTALNPQITKSYASGDRDYMMKLLTQGARLSYYMLLLLSLPVLLNTNYLLVAWLKIIPEHTVLFVQLTLILAMHECLAYPLITAMLATGKIKKYQIVAGSLNLMNLPVAYICLRLGMIPESVVVVAIIFSVLVQIVRMWLLKSMINLNVMEFLVKVYGNIIVVSIVAIIIPYFINTTMEESYFRFFIISGLAIVTTLASEFFVGCTKEERLIVVRNIKRIIAKRINNGK